MLGLALAGALVACGKQEGTASAAQVAAKVGSEEISVHQINFVLSRTNTGNTTPEVAQALRKQVLERLIDQQLAVDQAKESKLDRSPEVVIQIEAARRDVLARAYAQQIARGIAKPTPEEIKKYFVAHPQLFSERRVYSLREVLVPVNAANKAVADQVRSLVAAGKSMDDVLDLLRAKDVKFGGGSATRAAEQIPLELLARLHPMKDGQITIIDNPQGFNVLRVIASQSAPLTEQAALPRIEQFLSNQRAVEAVARNIKDLRAKATVSYMGDFAKAGGDAGSAGAPQQPSALTADPTTPLPAPASGGTLDDKTRGIIEKGVTGLK